MLGSRRNRDEGDRRRLVQTSSALRYAVVAVALLKCPSAVNKAQSRGNAGAVGSVESQKHAFPSFHELLGNLAKGGRDSHIPTAATMRADGKVENPKQVFHFPTASVAFTKTPTQAAGGLSPAPAWRRSAPLNQRRLPIR